MISWHLLHIHEEWHSSFSLFAPLLYPHCVLLCVATIRCHHSTAVDFWGGKSRKSGLILQMQYFLLQGSQATPTKGSSWVTSWATAAEWYWMRLGRSQKPLPFLERFGFRLLILRFNFWVCSAPTLQNKALTWPSGCLACLASWLILHSWLGLSLCCCSRWVISLLMVQLGFTSSALVQQTTSPVVDSQGPKWMGLTWLVLFHGENIAWIVLSLLCLMYHNVLQLPHEMRPYYTELNTVSTKPLLGKANFICLAKQILEIAAVFVNWSPLWGWPVIPTAIFMELNNCSCYASS